MNGLELIKQINGNGWYWVMDYRYEDDTNGVYLISRDYPTDKDAVFALMENNIEWEDE